VRSWPDADKRRIKRVLTLGLSGRSAHIDGMYLLVHLHGKQEAFVIFRDDAVAIGVAGPGPPLLFLLLLVLVLAFGQSRATWPGPLQPKHIKPFASVPPDACTHMGVDNMETKQQPGEGNARNVGSGSEGGGGGGGVEGGGGGGKKK
jgi:uncharacterized membrane protein YgcG